MNEKGGDVFVKDHTLQEEFWMGSFGNNYARRNQGDEMMAANISFFAKVLNRLNRSEGVGSVIEFGCNIGLNLMALHCLLPRADLRGIEINEHAFEQLQKLDYVQSVNQSFYDFQTEEPCDLAFMKGVLIHQPPEMLEQAYDILYRASAKYILIAEYYSPTPVEVEYHGNRSVLFKRDFCGEMLDRFPDVILCDYGFVYHRDRAFPQDDITWFLLEK